MAYTTRPDTRRRVPSAAKAPGSWKVLAFVLFGTLAIFYAANVYNHQLSALIGDVKWAALGALLLTALSTVNSSESGRRSLDLTGAFLLLSCVSVSILQSDDTRDSMLTFLTVGMAVLSGRFIALQCDTLAARRRLFDLIANLGRLVIASSFLMFLAGLSLGRSSDRFSAWADNPNTLAIMLAPALVILLAGALERRPRWIWSHVPFLVVGVLLLIETGSRASLLWFIVSCMGFWLFRFGFKFWAIVGAAVLIIVVGWWDNIVPIVAHLFARDSHGMRPTPVLSGREEVWGLAMILGPERPFFGYGLGSSPGLIEANKWIFQRHQGLHFHNSYLTVWIETGFLGVAGVAWVWIVALWRGAQQATRLRPLRLPNWPVLALPWVLALGAFVHAGFETWLLSAGNANAVIFWVCIWMLWDSRRLERGGPRPVRPPGFTARQPAAMPRTQDPYAPGPRGPLTP
ncbi:MAG TPA: O-antigen ligase family protein [Caulobacteraceae bacterium]